MPYLTDMSLWTQTFPVGPLACNCTLLGDIDQGVALAIDPGDEAPMILQRLAAAKMRLIGIVHTHAHIDHIGASQLLHVATGAPTHLHDDDLPLHQALPLQAQMLGLPPVVQGPIHHSLVDGMGIDVGGYRLEVAHTPGHSPGSVCFCLGGENLCFSGDTLFAGSVGRSDLPGGDPQMLVRSIRQRLYPLDGETRVIPGHGPATTIDRERCTNPFVRAS